MDALELRPVLEALLFAAAEPLTVEQLAEACEVEPALVTEGLAALAAAFDAEGRGVRLVAEAQGHIVITRPEYAPYVSRLLRGKKKMRLSRPALETLAIIAYKQPVTKAEVDAIRGVDSSGVLNTLLERELVTIRGRSKVVGRPLLYGTTGEFLSYFGLHDLGELPRIEELKAIVGEREPESVDADLEPLALPLPGAAPGEEVAVEAGADEADEAALLDEEPVALDDEPVLVAGIDPGRDPLVDPDADEAAFAGDDEDDELAADAAAAAAELGSEDEEHPEPA